MDFDGMEKFFRWTPWVIVSLLAGLIGVVWYAISNTGACNVL